MADLAEYFLKLFPIDEGVRGSVHYMVGQMEASREELTITKAELKKICRQQFGITASSFDDYYWPQAIRLSGANWDQPGRPRRAR